VIPRRWRPLARRAASVAVIAATVTIARRAAPPTLDQRVTEALARSRGSALDHAVAAFTDAGSVFGLTGCSVVLAAGGETGLGLRTAAAGSLAWFAAQVTKDVVDRRRPYELGTAELLVSVPHGSSWPSGHAAVAGAMADTLAHELPRAGGIAAWLVAVGVAASRLHVGVHHATDTIAGLAMGALAGEATRVAADAITSRRDA